MTHGNRARWVQVNVALERRGGPALPSARAVFDGLAPFLARWRRERAVTCWYFMRKPPDLRLRFRGPALERDVAPAVTALLARLRRQGFVRRSFSSVYEPETWQFGGPEAMRLVHAHFAADSTAWLAMDRLWAADRAALMPQALTLAVVNDLLCRTLEGRAEVWDVWCNLAQQLPPPADQEPPGWAIFGLCELLPAVSPAEATIVRRYARANAALGAGLLRICSRGRLRCGLRAILPFVAQFHFHRYGLDGSTQAALAAAMVQAFSPKRGMRGVEVEPVSLAADRLRRYFAEERQP
jgi:thiopeptide-type bacteriocin biosynthesis protein